MRSREVVFTAAVLMCLVILIGAAGCCIPVPPMATAPTAAVAPRLQESATVDPEEEIDLTPSTSAGTERPTRTPATAEETNRPVTPTRTPRPRHSPTPTRTRRAAVPAATPTVSATPTPSGSPASLTRNYYLDSRDGSDENSGGAPDEAWRTLAPLAEIELNPGDAVHFRAGSSWRGELVIDDAGSPARPILFTTYNIGKKPVFENPLGKWAIRVEAPWVIVEGLMVQKVREAGIILSADHTIVQDMEVTDAGMGVAVHSQHNIIRHNYLHDLKMIRNTRGGDDDYGAVGVWLFDSYNEVAYNRMVNCRAESRDYGTDGGGVELFGPDIRGAWIHHNWIEDSDGGMEVGGGSAHDHVISYNIFVNNSWALVLHLGGRYGSEIEGIRFEHNVVIETAPHDRALFTFVWGDPTERTLSVSNNIVHVVTGSVANDDAFLHTHNLYHLGERARLGFELGLGELVVHPRFVDLENGDFRLQKGSPAVDAGLDLGHEFDFAGRAVPQGSAPDLGAFEYDPEDDSGPLYGQGTMPSELP